MKNLWPEAFDVSSVKSTKTLLTEQATFLSKLTGGIVDAEVIEVPKLEAKMRRIDEAEFMYKFVIIGRFIDNYKFNAFYFWHDIGLYPVVFRLDEQLAVELGWDDEVNLEISTEEGIEPFIERIFGSLRFKRVVGSIMSLSK